MSRHVLLVDDAEDILEVARLSLELTTPWRITTLRRGAEVLERCAADPPDLVIMDVMMPELDGPSTLARLRQDPRTQGVPVVFLTARVHAADRARYQALGALGVIPKPFSALELAELICAQLGW